MKTTCTVFVLIFLASICMVGCSQKATNSSISSEYDKIVAAYRVAWSSDGTLAILHRSEISSQRDGIITLISPDGAKSQATHAVWDLRGWSKDGRYLMFLESTGNLTKPYRLSIYDHKTHHLLYIGDDTVFDACWSGEDTITYCSQSPLDATEKLTTQSLSGKVVNTVSLRIGTQQLQALALVYSPATNRLIIVVHDSSLIGKSSQTYLVLINHSSLIKIPNTTGCFNLAANPIIPQVAASLTGNLGETPQVVLASLKPMDPMADAQFLKNSLPPGFNDISLQYSPNGQQLLVSLEAGKQSNSIFLYSLMAGTLVKVSNGTNGVFSPDGKRIAYVDTFPLSDTGTYVTGNKVYICNVDGTASEMVDEASTATSSNIKRLGVLLVVLLVVLIAVLSKGMQRIKLSQRV